MRSRPKVQVYLSPPVALPGQMLDVDLVLEARSATPTDAITLTLSGTERSATETRGICELRAAFEPTKLEKGKQHFRGRFPVPAWASPSHRGPSLVVEYDLRVVVDIPWWPDVDRTFVVQVGQPAVEPPPAEVVFSSRAGDAKRDELYAEATLACDVVGPGGVLSGAVSFGNTRGAGQRSVELSFVRTDRGGGFSQEAQRFTATIHRGMLIEGEPIPFRITLPPSAAPSLEARLGRVEWHVLVSTRTAWRNEPILRIPIQVRPVSASPTRARVGAIGRARRAATWAQIAREKGWIYDDGADVMRARFGELTASLSVEQRTSGGPHVVGQVDLGGLGLDLDVRPRRWLTSIARKKIATGVARFDEAISIAAREPAQAEALFRGALAEVLAHADEVRMDDERLVVAWEGAGIDGASVKRAVSVVDGAARVLEERVEALPPPAHFADRIDAWRAFAARLGGRLRPGRPEILRAEKHGREARVRAVWGEDDAPSGLALEIARAARDLGDRPLDRRGEAARAALEKHGQVAIERERVSLLVRDDACDLGVVEPHLDALAELALLIDDVRDAGPYR